MEQLTDEVLADCANQGCLESFECLVEKYQVPLVQFLTRRIGSREDAEDLTQDTFVRAYQNLHRYDNQWRFSTWLFTIARRLCINEQRRRGVRELPDSHPESLAGVAGAVAEPAEELEARENRHRLWDHAAAVLSEPKFTALWLFYVEDLPVVEIARVLGRSRVAVKTMMFRARQELMPTMQGRKAARYRHATWAELKIPLVTKIKKQLADELLSEPAAARASA